MKFRAVIRDPETLKEFFNLITTLSKLTKHCIMSITTDKIQFIVNEDTGNAAPLIWADICTDTNFTEYTMEGINDRHRRILLELNPLNMTRVITVIRNGAQYCKFKLTNVQYPCITVETEVSSNISNRYRKITYDVPVIVIPKGNWDVYSLPEIPKSKISLTIPSSRYIRNHIDKLKSLSTSVTLTASGDGEMRVTSETDMLTVTTKYRNLLIQEYACGTNEEHSTPKDFTESCVVDCKKIAIFFASMQVSTAEWSCGISQDRLIHLRIEAKPGIMIHSIIPAFSI